MVEMGDENSTSLEDVTMDVEMGVAVGVVSREVVGCGKLLGVKTLAPRVSSDEDMGTSSDGAGADWRLVEVATAEGVAMGVATGVNRVVNSISCREKAVTVAKSAI